MLEADVPGEIFWRSGMSHALEICRRADDTMLERAHPGRQDEAFAIIQDVVRYVAERKSGFLWSNLAKSTDGLTVVNIEAIADEGNVGEFFSDPVFVEKFKRLDSVSTSEFHIYRVTDRVLPLNGEGTPT